MKVIGLTGGIGTGKSTAAAYLKSKGFVHIDADEIGRQLTAAGGSMLPVLNDVFGPEGEMGKPGIKLLYEDGTLDRKALASIVFTDKKKKKRLDDIMFREIIKEIDREIAFYKETREKCSADKSIEEDVQGVLLDAPLLFEAGLDSKCDLVVLVVAEETVRIDRVCKRDGITAREVRNRINSQMSDEEKIKLADIVVDNSRSEKELYDKLDKTICSKIS